VQKTPGTGRVLLGVNLSSPVHEFRRLSMTKKQFDELLKALKGVELALIELRTQPQVIYVPAPPYVQPSIPYVVGTIPNSPWPISTCGGTNTSKGDTSKYEVHS
jgi:hypothetical protein